VIVIAEILGVPASERAVFKRWSEEIGALLDPFVTPEALERGMKSAVEMQRFFFEIFADRRARPRDDLVSALVAVEERGDVLSESELFATCALLLGAGHQTTTNLLGNALWALAENPDERHRLQVHPELMDSAVEEFLRHGSPVQVTARVATGDYRIDGKRIEKGDFVILALGAANRDPTVFREPDRLDLTRAPNPHVSFGQGIHFCLGAPLARMEAQIALDTLLRRFPAFEVPCETPQWKPTAVSRGLASFRSSPSGYAPTPDDEGAEPLGRLSAVEGDGKSRVRSVGSSPPSSVSSLPLSRLAGARIANTTEIVHAVSRLTHDVEKGRVIHQGRDLVGRTLATSARRSP
jgi:cytochrome P450